MQYIINQPPRDSLPAVAAMCARHYSVAWRVLAANRDMAIERNDHRYCRWRILDVDRFAALVSARPIGTRDNARGRRQPGSVRQAPSGARLASTS